MARSLRQEKLDCDASLLMILAILAILTILGSH